MDNQPKNLTENKPSYSSEFIFGLMGGGLVGTILGIWYAPSSGRDLLQRLVRRVEGESVEDSIQEGRAIAHRNRADQLPAKNPE